MRTLKDFIKVEAEKHARRYQNYHNYLEIEFQRNKRRIKNPPAKVVKVPIYWSVDRKFNPFYVLKHIDKISKSIEQKLLTGRYSPHSPYIHQIKKNGGGIREVSVYQIPDAAVSSFIYSELVNKNRHRFSGLSYAYRSDRNVHYAIQDIGIELSGAGRLFISEFDFSDFFGSINHDYLFSQLKLNGFTISKVEHQVIRAFLKGRKKGVPQGTSISLFLANLVCWKLDRDFEREGLRFARYADDTVIWSKDYSKICNSYNIISEFSRDSNIQINAKKSSGISLMVKEEMPNELSSKKEYVEFLGYQLSLDKVSIKKTAVRRIKKQISYLLYRNLIQPIKQPILRNVTVPSNGNDADLVTAIMQIRRYLYGNLNEAILKKYLNGHYQKLKFKGVMSFYPLINDSDQLQELDRWLVRTIWNAIQLRKKLFSKRLKMQFSLFPYNVDCLDVVDVFKRQAYNKKNGLLEVPSFLRIHNAIRYGLTQGGIDVTAASKSANYNY